MARWKRPKVVVLLLFIAIVAPIAVPAVAKGSWSFLAGDEAAMQRAPVAEIDSFVRQVRAYPRATLAPAPRRVLVSSLVAARRAYLARNGCGAIKLLDTVPAMLSPERAGRQLARRATALITSVQRLQSRILSTIGRRCGVRFRTTLTPSAGETAGQALPVPPAPQIEFENYPEADDTRHPPAGRTEPTIPQIALDPAPLALSVAQAGEGLAWRRKTQRKVADDLRVDQRSEWRLFQAGWPIDPGVASAGDVVVYSGNTFIDVSLKGGAAGTFADVPIQSLTTDTPDLRYNGDQDIVYDPATDLFFFIDQSHCLLNDPGGVNQCVAPPTAATDAQAENRYRLFAADPDELKKNIRKWMFWDILSRDVVANRAWLDYPMLALGQNALYMAANSFHPNGEVLVRIKTPQLRTMYDNWLKTGTKGKAAVESVTQTTGSRPVQDVGTTGYFANWVTTPTTALVIQSVKESSPFLFISSRVEIAPWDGSETGVSLSPDGKDINCCSPDVINGTLNKGTFWFAWGIARHRPTSDNPTPLPPRIRIESVSASTGKKTLEQDGDVGGLASGFPALASNIDGEVAMVFTYGGEGKSHSQSAVVLLDAPRRAVTFSAHLRSGAPGVTSNRIGDYYKIHRDGKNGKLFSAASFIEEAGPFASGDYIRFGRGDPSPPATLPDLKPIQITRDSYTISNLTGAPVGTFAVRGTIQVNGGSGVTLTFNHPAGIGPLTTVSAYFPGCFSGVSKASIVVDPTNTIKESNETNNTISGGPWTCIK